MSNVSSEVRQREDLNYMEQAVANDIVKRYRDVSSTYQPHPSIQHSAWIIREEYQEFKNELREKDFMWDRRQIYRELLDLIVASYKAIIDNKLYLDVIRQDAEDDFSSSR